MAEQDDPVSFNDALGYTNELIAKIQTLVGVVTTGKWDLDTVIAVEDWQAENDLFEDGRVGELTLAAMEDDWRADEISADGVEPGQEPIPNGAIDLRSAKRKKPRGRSRGTRGWDAVTGITLHQTAVDFGSPSHKGIVNVPCHAMTFQGGETVILHSPRNVVWHGNGFNTRDIGIEVSCRAAGIEGVFSKRRGASGPNTFWRSRKRPDDQPLEASDVQLASTRELVKYYVELVAASGGRLQFVHAHRQSANKPSDPGSRIWKEVGLWAQEECGLTSGPTGWCLKGGHPIPAAWDPRCDGVRYSKRVAR
jgi:hypothetical protein